MIIVREVLTAKPGKASRLAKLFKKAFVNEPNFRVMTDLVGDYNTVVMEIQAKDLAEFEQQLKKYETGEMFSNLDAETKEEMSKYTDMYLTGSREIYQIVE
jgi:hypothetical protein